MVKAVIFDSDGMLTHGPRFSEKYSQEHRINIGEMAPFFAGPFQNCIVGKTDLKEELEKGWLEKWKWTGSVDALLEYWFAVGDTLDIDTFATVAELRAKGITVVLATNQEKYRTDYLSAKFAYDQAFDRVFSSAYVGMKKPFAEFFQEIADYLESKHAQLTKDQVVFWDDDIENVEGAGAFGFQSKLYTTFPPYRDEMIRLGLL